MDCSTSKLQRHFRVPHVTRRLNLYLCDFLFLNYKPLLTDGQTAIHNAAFCVDCMTRCVCVCDMMHCCNICISVQAEYC